VTADNATRRIRAERLLNRRVRARNGRVIGRIQELRVDRDGDRYEVKEYVFGAGGLLERLAIAARTFRGHRAHARVARWDQVDLADPDRPRLTCDVADLRLE
jgi:hypothetical protein